MSNYYTGRTYCGEYWAALMRRCNYLSRSASLGYYGRGSWIAYSDQAMCVSSDGYTHRADSYASEIRVYNPSNSLVGTYAYGRVFARGQYVYSLHGQSLGVYRVYKREQNTGTPVSYFDFSVPTSSVTGAACASFSIGKDSRVYVSISGIGSTPARIRSMGSDGVTAWEYIAGTLDTPGAYISAPSIGTDSGNNTLVLDSVRKKVLVLSPSGAFIGEWPLTTDGHVAGVTYVPTIMCVDSYDYVFITNQLPVGNVECYKLDGTLITTIIASTGWPFYSVYSLFADLAGRVYISGVDLNSIATAFTDVWRHRPLIPPATFYGYTSASARVSLPRYPEETDLTTPMAMYSVVDHLLDIRSAIESLVDMNYFRDPDSRAEYTMTDSDPNNLLWIATGERYTWARTAEQIVASNSYYDVDLYELDLCITKLEAALL